MGNVLRTRYINGIAQPADLDFLAVEEPLEIRIQGRPIAVTMRTPGDDIHLTLGFLFSEGVIDGIDDVHAIAHVDDPVSPKGNTVDVVLSPGVPMARTHRADRRLFASSSCGICGKESIDRIVQEFPALEPRPLPSADLILSLPKKLRAAQAQFTQTGGIHAAALFSSSGDLIVANEDIGRHNALDKVLGFALEKELIPCQDTILLLSGRAGFELVQKALMAQIPIVAAIGAPSTLASELAFEGGLKLIAFLRDASFNYYIGKP
jgi:FdhD protein